MTAIARDRIPTLLRAELAALTNQPVALFVDDALLSDLGVDSLGLIEVLLSVREQILEDVGLSVDDVSDPPVLPWLETVGELIGYVRSSLPESVTEE
jgi:Phosphopantetheine attachment site